MPTVSPIASAAATSGAAGATNDQPTTNMNGPNAMLDRDAFLKLLVAQLKYQDPTKPADASAMVAQSAQLTMVDRLNEISTQLTASASSQRLGLASSVVGKEITFLDADSVSHTEVVTSARIDGDDLVLIAGDFQVPMSSITTVGGTPAAAAAPVTAPTTPTPTTPTTPTPTTPPTTDPTTATDPVEGVDPDPNASTGAA
jgi:flagellar basal-body rod modification protein FlgD